MNTVAADLLLRAHETLDDARRIAAANVPAVAPREAYMVAFHAAQALLRARPGRAPKTHAGVHQAFGEIARADAKLGPSLGRFLASAYDAKQTADYATLRPMTTAHALEMIEEAARLLAAVESALGKADGS